jgi:hypothetical protein
MQQQDMIMQASGQQPSKLIPNLLVLITVLGFALTGWLVGHILRHSIPAYQFQHSPIEEINPKIENGFQFDGIRRQATLMEESAQGLFTSEGSFFLGQALINACVGNTYYTSLPAKCHSADGSLVKVGSEEVRITLIPQDK